MKKLFAVMMVLMMTGCGVMNQYDRDSAIAHSQMQTAIVNAWAAQQGKPLCRMEFEAGVPVTGLKSIECAAPVSMAGMPQLGQYQQPKGPWDTLADGVKTFMGIAPAAIAGAYLGGKVIDGMADLGAAGIAGAGTHITGTGNVAGTGNQTFRATGSFNPTTTTTTTTTTTNTENPLSAIVMP